MMGLQRYSLVLAGLLIFSLVIIVSPVSAAVVTIDNMTPGGIPAAIAAAGASGTVILDPGIYFEHGIAVSHTVTLRANTTAGGSRVNTLIDAQNAGRIFSVSGTSPLTIENLTLQNGAAPDGAAGLTGLPGGDGASGGAIYSDGPVTLSSSAITGCSAGNGGHGGDSANDGTVRTGGSGGNGGNGGAVYSTAAITIISSTITSGLGGNGGIGGGGISSEGNNGGAGGNGGNGGAVYSTVAVDIDSSTITNCRAGNGGAGGYGGSGGWSNPPLPNGGNGGNGGYGGNGGAVFSSGSTEINSSIFGNCMTGNGASGGDAGSGYMEDYPPGTNGLPGTTGTDGDGGAIYTSGITSVASSSFTGCTGNSFGGAIMSTAVSLTVTDSAFSDCVAEYGGAIGSGLSGTGIISITTSTFSDCSAELGGSIMAGGNSLTVTSSTFTDSTASIGGAIVSGMSEAGTTTITSSSFSRCWAEVYGGAIFSMSEETTIASSTFSECFALMGGAVMTRSSGNGTLSVTASTFSDCIALIGGAIGSASESGATIVSSDITNCVAILYGGAVVSMGSLNVSDSHITNCTTDIASVGILRQATPASFTGQRAQGDRDMITTLTGSSFPALVTSHMTLPDGRPIASLAGGTINAADVVTSISPFGEGMGGALCLLGGNATVTRTIISNCSATGSGGAIANLGNNLSVISSSITDCFAPVNGSAIYNEEGNATVRFSRIYHDNATNAVWNTAGTFDAANNWWGSNTDPAGYAAGGDTVTTAPWLVLGITANPAAIMMSRNATIRTNLTFNSAGSNTAAGGIYLPAGILNTFAVTAGSGSVIPGTAGMVSGAAWTTFHPSGTGRSTISGTVDDKTVFVSLPVTETPPAPPAPSVWSGDYNDDAPVWTTVPVTPTQVPPASIEVNVGGNSAVNRVVVTGTGIAGLIVTGTVQPGPGTNLTAPMGTVFQYISLVPARFATITGAVIHFSVPQSWLDENHIAPGSIVLYHQTANGWEALPTTLLSTKDGSAFFSAQSGSFSLFAIAGTPGSAVAATVSVPPAVLGSAVQEQAPVPAATTQTPVTTQTTAPPVTTAKPSSPSPLLNIVLVIAAIGVLGAGGFLARRWWIHRQNPALFKEYG